MTMTIQDAAAALLQHIPAPRGAINSYVGHDTGGAFICLMIDPLYWNAVHGVPNNYEGHRVLVEKREPTIAFGAT
jgi:hypothetical protein